MIRSAFTAIALFALGACGGKVVAVEGAGGQSSASSTASNSTGGPDTCPPEP